MARRSGSSGTLAEWFGALGLVAEVTKRVNPGRIVLIDGTRIETKSALDARTLSKEAPEGIIGCEASQLDATVFSRMRGRITPRNGWVFLAGTFESSVGWYPQPLQGLAGGRVRRAELLPAVVDEPHAVSGRKGRSAARRAEGRLDRRFLHGAHSGTARAA